MEAQRQVQFGQLQEVKQQLESRQSSKSDRERENRIWNKQQVYLIAAFLSHNHLKFSSETAKKKWKVFKFMSLFVQTKNINQCRSYFRKLLQTFKTVSQINSFFKSSLADYESVMGGLKHKSQRLYQQYTVSEDGNTQKLFLSEQRDLEAQAPIVKKQEYRSVSEYGIIQNLERTQTQQHGDLSVDERVAWSHYLFNQWIASLERLYRFYRLY